MCTSKKKIYIYIYKRKITGWKGLIIDIEFRGIVASARFTSFGELCSFLFHLRQSLLPQEEDAKGEKNRGKEGWPRLKKRDLADDPFRLSPYRTFVDGNCIDCLRATLYGQPLRATKGAPVASRLSYVSP